MKHYLVGVLITICAAGASHAGGRIYGGQNATAGQFPFMVALNDAFQYCNGVIVAPSWILTGASHCILYRSPSAKAYVGGPANQATGYRYSERAIHPDYDAVLLKNDIALIRINGVMEYNETIQPVELGAAPAPSSTCTFVGWGVTETQDYPDLQYVDTTVIDLPTCQGLSDVDMDDYYLGPEQICTQNSPGQGACIFDWGGALLCDGKLSGIYSYTLGYECGMGKPDVFTNIEAYSDWILSNV